MTFRTPLVGRQEPLLELVGSLDDAAASRGAVAIVSGELGIGKTRLIEELAARARERGAIVAMGRWFESREQPADIGVRDALRGLVEDARVRSTLDPSDPQILELTRFGPEFAQPLGARRHEKPGRREGEQYQLWRAVFLLLRASCSVAPTVVILDDLQWADPGSLGLLVFLAQRIDAMPVLLLGAYREADVPDGHPLHHALAELVRVPSFQHVTLRGLSVDEVAEMATGISSLTVSAAFASVLHRQTSGNPLFVGEIVRHLLRPGEAPDVASLASDLAISDDLRHAVVRRLDTLSPGCRTLLDQAAVIGREFDIALIERLGPSDCAHPRTEFDEALRAATLIEVAPGCFDFAHPLVRSVIYHGLPASERVEAHLAAAAALESYYSANADDHSREIARHLLAAGGLARPKDTVEYCLKGARQARESFALDESRSLLQGGLAACERLSEANGSWRAQLLVELGYAETGLGNPDAALVVYREALGLYEKLGSAHETLDTQRWLAATLARYGRWADVLAISRPSLATAPEEATDAYLGLVGSHAMALMISGMADEAQHWVEKLPPLAFDARTRAVGNHTSACWHSWAQGDPNECGSYFREARRLFQQEGLLATASQVALDHAVVSYFLGHFEESAEADQEAERLASETGRPSVLADLYAFRSLVSVHRGDWTLAAEQRTRCREIASGLGGTTIYGQLVERGEGLEAFWRAGASAAQPLLKAGYPLRNEPLLAVLLAEQGDSAAEPLIDQFVAAVPPDGRGLVWLSIALPVVAALTRLGRAEAGAWERSLGAYAGGLFAWFLVDIERGQVHGMAKRWEEADACFGRAIETCERQRLRPFLAHAWQQRALMLLGRRERADRREASALLQQAEELFDELGLGYMRDKIRRVRVIPTRGRPMAMGPSGLTTRESTVVSLLAEGLSNRAIASALYLQERTVAGHLESIYRKLGVTNRGAAIAWALREGQPAKPSASHRIE